VLPLANFQAPQEKIGHSVNKKEGKSSHILMDTAVDLTDLVKLTGAVRFAVYSVWVHWPSAYEYPLRNFDFGLALGEF